MLEDAADDLRVFDAGDDRHRPAAVLAGFDLDAEDPFDAAVMSVMAYALEATDAPVPRVGSTP